jgi:hypothetical protein
MIDHLVKLLSLELGVICSFNQRLKEAMKMRGERTVGGDAGERRGPR